MPLRGKAGEQSERSAVPDAARPLGTIDARPCQHSGDRRREESRIPIASRYIGRHHAKRPIIVLLLLKLHLGSCSLKLGLDLGGVLADAFLQGLRCTFDKILGLFEAEPGE
jgi:hypothetical protein